MRYLERRSQDAAAFFHVIHLLVDGELSLRWRYRSLDNLIDAFPSIWKTGSFGMCNNDQSRRNETKISNCKRPLYFFYFYKQRPDVLWLYIAPNWPTHRARIYPNGRLSLLPRAVPNAVTIYGHWAKNPFYFIFIYEDNKMAHLTFLN